MLAKVVNDNASCLIPRSVLTFFAGKPVSLPHLIVIRLKNLRTSYRFSGYREGFRQLLSVAASEVGEIGFGSR